MRTGTIAALFLLVLTSCEEMLMPQYDETQFVNITVSKGKDEIQIEGFRIVAGLGGIRQGPWVEKRNVRGAEESGNLYYRINCGGVLNKPTGQAGVHPMVCIQDLQLCVLQSSGWVVGKQYRLYESKELSFRTKEDYHIKMLYIPEEWSECASWNEKKLTVTEGEIETINPTVNRDYYAIRFSFTAVDEEGERFIIKGTAQNNKE